jgi:two-component system NtrC family sensor kinase
MTKDKDGRAGPGDDQDSLISPVRYRRMLFIVVLSVSVIAILPLMVMSAITYHQYQEALHSGLTRPMLRFAAAGKESLESYVSERLSALAMVTREMSFEELKDRKKLESVLTSMRESLGGIVDLGLLNEEGIQVSYAGPYALEGKNYSGEEWFQKVSANDTYVSDVILGYRNFPHIIFAVQRNPKVGPRFVLRATIDSDTDAFEWLMRTREDQHPPEQSPVCQRCHSLGIQPYSDAFIINQKGILQTTSKLYGDVLKRTPLPPIPHSSEAEILELKDETGKPLIVSYANIRHSPFTLVLLNPRAALHAGWQSLRRDLLVFPAISSILILAVVIGGAIYVVKRLREADLKRAALYHKMEYTNKLAALGRLGAGVAHEINNPLSIIIEKGGLLRDLLTISEGVPPKEKLVDLVNSVLKSAERCGGITHRLLGFAKHMDVQRETINLDGLLREVLGFLEKEASYRAIQVDFSFPEEPPSIVSDRGQLQQVFLNIINNAFAAVEDGGRIEVGIQRVKGDAVAVSVADNGVGIPEDQLRHIFDPFFTTKKGTGTGLGLSITYGIVQKLGGQIAVKSRVGEGTTFTVTLPIGREDV